MSTTADRLARLSPAQRALLEQRLLARPERANRRIPAGSVESDVAPLSYAQKRLWFADQLDPSRCVNNVPRAIRLRGPLNIRALESALQAIVNRQAALRTRFPIVDGEPVQQVLPNAPFQLNLVRRVHNIEPWATAQARAPFDLARDVPVRGSLVELAEDDHVLMLTFHHIASDGWSAGVFNRELSALYASFARGEPTTLRPLAIQYADYAAWQRNIAQSGGFEAQLDYWERALAGATVRLQLPADARPAGPQTYSGGRVKEHISTELAARLEALAHASGATLFGVLLAGFQSVLARHTGQDDVVVGTPVAGRSHQDTWDLIGCFINSIALRADLSGNPRFEALVEQVAKTVQAGLSHQDVPFDLVVQRTRPPRDAGYSPVFQVLFVLQNTPVEPLSLIDLDVEAVEIDIGAAQMELELVVQPGANGLALTAVYNTELFAPASVQRLLAHYVRFLSDVVEDPAQPIKAVALLDAAEREQLLAWGSGPRREIESICVHTAVERQAARTPDAVALTAGSEQLTYRDLDERGNQVAHALVTAGVQCGDRVAVRLPRSADLLVGILGVLKCGAAYVPLDPSYPPERLRYMVEDSAARLVVDEAFIASDAVRQQSTAPVPGDRATTEHVAYVLYTSGSAGRPKGVMVTHANLANLFGAIDSLLEPEGAGAWLALTSASFDISVTELLWTVSRGIRVVLADAELATRALPELIHTHGVSHMQCTPSLLRALVEKNAVLQSLRSLRMLLLAGEMLPSQLARDVVSDSPLRVLNLYGPTETTVYSTAHEFERDCSSVSVPIGEPLANTSLYVLDVCDELAPVGVPGELLIGGAGVARGYVGQPELTNERFVPDRWARTPGGRAYRTGDRVRWLSDGTLEFLGRVDQQTKVRGVRVEPGEVEAVLEQHPSVARAAVIARETRGGEQTLAAYFVPSADASPPGAAELRRHLKTSLPEPMVPSSFSVLEALPLTPSGKVNRAALPAPRVTEAEASGYCAPRDDLEQSLARLWAEVLDVERVGIRDNFFELGGHSLLAARLFVALEEAFNHLLPFDSFFPDADIEHQAELLRNRSASRRDTCLVPLQARGNRPTFVCVHALDGDVLRFEPLARAIGEDQPFFGIRAFGLGNDGGPEPQTVEAIARRYVQALVEALPGPYYLGGFSSGCTLAYEIAQQLSARGERVALLAFIDGVAPSGATRSPRQGLAQVRDFLSDLPAYAEDALRPERLRTKLRASASRLRHILRSVTHRDRTGAPLHVLEAVASFSERHYAVAVAHDAAMRRYRATPYQGRVTLFRGRIRGLVTSHEPTLGWATLVRGGVETYHLEGRHELVLKEPYVRTLASQLRRAMDQVTRPTSPV